MLSSKIILKKYTALKQIRVCTSLLTSHYSTNREPLEKIDIPNRIPRGPTDILRALESTIQRDPTTAHYKYHDDPYLIPMSNVGKRTFAMAKEAGRKAAHWIRQEHSELFNHRECDPPIEAFFPKTIFNENSEVTEQDLVDVIDRNQVSDAILINKLLKDKNLEISRKTKQDLLELLCHNNSEEDISEDFIEERWFRQSTKAKERQKNIWKDGGAAEEVFASLEAKSNEAYCAIIQGMAKHFQAARAEHLFSEALEKSFPLNTDTFNAVISVAHFLKEGYELRWAFIVNTLQTMEKTGLRPNLGTLNSVLFVLSTMGGNKIVKDSALQTIREFKKLGVEPSLGSWYYMLITFCKERGPVSTILHDILQEIDNKNHKIQHLSDTNFFVTAMDICRNHLKDYQLGEKVNKLLYYGNNYDLIGDSYKESIYYRHYVSLVLANLSLEDFMEKVYNKLVPHIYVPEPSVMHELLRHVEMHGAIEYIPKLWSDMTVFDHVNRENLIDIVLDIMIQNKPSEGSELLQNFSNIAWSVFENIDGQNEERFSKLNFTGDLLGKIMILVLKNNDFTKAVTIMNRLNKGAHTIVGVPKIEALSLFVDHCIKEKVPSKALECLQYCVDTGFPESVKLGEKLKKNMTLDENQLSSLSKIIGSQ